MEFPDHDHGQNDHGKVDEGVRGLAPKNDGSLVFAGAGDCQVKILAKRPALEGLKDAENQGQDALRTCQNVDADAVRTVDTEYASVQGKDAELDEESVHKVTVEGGHVPLCRSQGPELRASLPAASTYPAHHPKVGGTLDHCLANLAPIENADCYHGVPCQYL